MSNFQSSMEPATEEEMAAMENDTPRVQTHPDDSPRAAVQVEDQDGGNPRSVLTNGPTLSELNAQAQAEEAKASVPVEPLPAALKPPAEVPHPSDLAMADAAGEEPKIPELVIGDFTFKCRSRAPGSITAKISSFTAKFAQVASKGIMSEDGTIDRNKVSTEEVIALSLAPSELFEVAKALVLQEDRDELTQRWEGEWTHPTTGDVTYLGDQDVIEAGDLLPALMELLPHYTAASAPKA